MLQFAAYQLDKCRTDVEPFGWTLTNSASVGAVRRSHEHRYPHSAIEEVAFVDESVVPVHFPMVGGMDDDRVFEFTACLDCVENFTDLIINERDVASVISAQPSNFTGFKRWIHSLHKII